MGSDCSRSNPFGVVKVVFSPEVFERMKQTIGSVIPESGGALFGKRATIRSPLPYITDFVFDADAKCTLIEYEPNFDYLNPVREEKWNNHSLELQGVAHSHPSRCRPSSDDLECLRSMFSSTDIPFFVAPIIYSKFIGDFKLFCYLVGPDEHTPAYRVDYRIMNEEEYKKAISELDVAGITPYI